MNRPVECLRCHTQMETGFVADAAGDGAFLQQYWTAGEPETSFWRGLKVHKRSRFPLITLRCPNCGYLESYTTTRAFAP